ncbi:hypothetical protein SAMN05216464_10599 [Mucilaginibacter pineti]|uniref:Uncharacterized protein n=1 Tax=Mucilaginibacter pineti TaxID=1391627 RepID=A0A1G7BNR3_9SPHI|nr:hypothetical protein [Mucilaginibacter pineti]SDE28593.1 hypothetical protein SAMN05216464_10599 [Mucilaginibacter pineti]
MRTSLNSIAQTDALLHKKLRPADTLLMEVKTMLDADFQNNILAQQQVYTLVQQYSRKQLKIEIEAVHGQLFTSPGHLSFRQKIARIFLNR